MKRPLVIAAGLLLTTIAQAQSNAYVIGAAGVSQYDDDCGRAPRCDTSGAAGKFIGGVTVAPGVSVELTAFNFGQETASDGFTSVAVKMSGLGAGLALSADLGPGFRGRLRGGLASIRVRGTGNDGGFLVDFSETSPQVYVGLAVAYSVAPNLFVEAAIDVTRGKLRESVTPVSAFTLGLGLAF